MGQGIQEWAKQNLWTAFKKFAEYGLPKQTISLISYINYLKTVFHKFYLVHSWIPWPMCPWYFLQYKYFAKF